jgi:hypothetical protein
MLAWDFLTVETVGLTRLYVLSSSSLSVGGCMWSGSPPTRPVRG